ncbi:MAG: glycerophosphodiester phosphodiesterase [Verrucomicrobiaceae bacterium]|nr:glycerophosphodiester phosphodiesterase [Verrucomicrobiaceae bacterium]
MNRLTANAVEIIAHRGASHEAPENTLASFRLGWEQQADGDELDVYLTTDDQVIVIHDANTKRTTGVDMAVAKKSLRELQTLDAGSFKGPQWKGEKLPALAEVVATIPKGRRLFIEIKCGPEVLAALERVLGASGKKPEQLVIIGFGDETMRQAKLKFPHLKVYWLASMKPAKNGGTALTLDEVISKAKGLGVDGVDLAAEPQMDAAFVSKIHAAGLQMYVWTVDDPKLAASLAKAGVDGITTNRPGWMREQLASAAQKP